MNDPRQERRSAGEADGAAVFFTGINIEFPLSDGGTYKAVAEADLTVGASEFVAIVGPTGCGKTTLLNVAAGLLRPRSGEMRVFGRRLEGLKTIFPLALTDKLGFFKAQASTSRSTI